MIMQCDSLDVETFFFLQDWQCVDLKKQGYSPVKLLVRAHDFKKNLVSSYVRMFQVVGGHLTHKKRREHETYEVGSQQVLLSCLLE
jgi:hypothetical protein